MRTYAPLYARNQAYSGLSLHLSNLGEVYAVGTDFPFTSQYYQNYSVARLKHGRRHFQVARTNA